MGHRQGGGAGLTRLATGRDQGASRPSVTATSISQEIRRFWDDAASYDTSPSRYPQRPQELAAQPGLVLVWRARDAVATLRLRTCSDVVATRASARATLAAGPRRGSRL